MPDAHAVLSASSSHRWLFCTPSARLESQFENAGSEATREGTAAHALAEFKLRKALGQTPTRPVSSYDSGEMEEATDDYVQYIMEQLARAKDKCKDPVVLVEQRLDFSRYVPDGFGTGDCIIVSDDVLHIIDLKYGTGVLVEAQDNPQMKLYALGALEVFDTLYDIKTVAMTIFQPRRDNISTWTLSVKDLRTWAEGELKQKADLAFKGEGEFVPGSWCTFCRASSKCRARAKEIMCLAQKEFRLPPLITDDEIEEVLKVLPSLTKWANDISEYALNAAINGKHWKGFKVVEGKSNRKYSDETAVAQAAIKAGFNNIYRQSLITLTDMEKLMGKSKFAEVLGSLIVKPKGKPTLVPETDKRPAMKLTDAINEFSEI